MASKRSIKKEVIAACSDLFVEAVATGKNAAKENPAALTALLSDILKIESDYIARINCYQKVDTTAYFKKIRSEFDADMEGIIKRINAQIQ